MVYAAGRLSPTGERKLARTLTGAGLQANALAHTRVVTVQTVCACHRGRTHGKWVGATKRSY